MQSQLIRPYVIQQDVQVKDRCKMYDIDYNEVAKTLKLPNKSHLLPTKYCDNGWTYNTNEFTESATTKFDLVCENSYLATIILAIGAFGIIIGTPTMSFLADHIGRKYTFLTIITIYSFACISSPIFLRDIVSFTIARFIANGMINALFEIPYILVMELVGSSYRSKVSFLSSIACSFGSCMFPIISHLTAHWVKLSVAQLTLIIPFFIGLIFLPESPSWLFNQRRFSEATKVLKNIAEINGINPPTNLEDQLKNVFDKQETINSLKQNDKVRDIIFVTELRKYFIIITMIISSNILAENGLELNTLNFHGSEFTNYFLLAIVNLPGLILGWYLMEGKLGRRWTNSMFLIFSGISLCIPLLIPSDDLTLMAILSFVGKFGISASYMIIYQQAAELFPTTIRSQAIGLSSSCAAILGISVPFITYLGRFGIWIPLLIIGITCFIVGITASFLPETLNENLPQNIHETKLFGQNKKYFSLANKKSN